LCSRHDHPAPTSRASRLCTDMHHRRRPAVPVHALPRHCPAPAPAPAPTSAPGRPARPPQRLAMAADSLARAHSDRPPRVRSSLPAGCRFGPLQALARPSLRPKVGSLHFLYAPECDARRRLTGYIHKCRSLTCSYAFMRRGGKNLMSDDLVTHVTEMTPSDFFSSPKSIITMSSTRVAYGSRMRARKVRS
jgi:hypothetical protein